MAQVHRNKSLFPILVLFGIFSFTFTFVIFYPLYYFSLFLLHRWNLNKDPPTFCISHSAHNTKAQLTLILTSMQSVKRVSGWYVGSLVMTPTCNSWVTPGARVSLQYTIIEGMWLCQYFRGYWHLQGMSRDQAIFWPILQWSVTSRSSAKAYHPLLQDGVACELSASKWSTRPPAQPLTSASPGITVWGVWEWVAFQGFQGSQTGTLVGAWNGIQSSTEAEDEVGTGWLAD